MCVAKNLRGWLGMPFFGVPYGTSFTSFRIAGKACDMVLKPTGKTYQASATSQRISSVSHESFHNNLLLK